MCTCAALLHQNQWGNTSTTSSAKTKNQEYKPRTQRCRNNSSESTGRRKHDIYQVCFSTNRNCDARFLRASPAGIARPPSISSAPAATLTRRRRMRLCLLPRRVHRSPAVAAAPEPSGHPSDGPVSPGVDTTARTAASRRRGTEQVAVARARAQGRDGRTRHKAPRTATSSWKPFDQASTGGSRRKERRRILSEKPLY